MVSTLTFAQPSPQKWGCQSAPHREGAAWETRSVEGKEGAMLSGRRVCRSLSGVWCGEHTPPTECLGEEAPHFLLSCQLCQMQVRNKEKRGKGKKWEDLLAESWILWTLSTFSSTCRLRVTSRCQSQETTTGIKGHLKNNRMDYKFAGQ